MQSIYYSIYEDLRDMILDGEYAFQSYIPAESTLTKRYQCSHNTVRKAISVLMLHGFVQPIRARESW